MKRLPRKKPGKQTKLVKVSAKDLMQRFFIEHIKSEKKYEKYQQGLKFLRNFKPTLYKGEEHTFLINLTKNFSQNPISVSLSTNIERRQNPIFTANIRFTKGRVIIETLQGTPWLKEMREFERIVNIPSSRYLVKEIVNQAKKMGFEKVMLIDPTKHGSYKDPHLLRLFDEETRKLNMKIVFGEATKEEKKMFIAKKKELLKIHQERMRKLYENVARGEGFVKLGKYFVKNLK